MSAPKPKRVYHVWLKDTRSVTVKCDDAIVDCGAIVCTQREAEPSKEDRFPDSYTVRVFAPGTWDKVELVKGSDDGND